jgi:hypothetical protein
MMRSELWFILAFVAAFSSVPAFNYFTDPLGLYGGAESRLPPSTTESMARNLQLLDLMNSAERLTEPDVILGTSHVGWGIDTCGSDIGKLWRSGMKLNETISIFSELVMNSESERLIILDMAALAEWDGQLVEQHMRLQDTLFNLEIAKWSLLKLPGLRQKPADAFCEIDYLSDKRDVNKIPQHLLEVFSSGLSIFEVGINMIAETCQNPKVRVAIVLFPFYLSSDTLQFTKGLEGFLDGSQFLSPSISKGGCPIRIINLASRDFQTRVSTGTLGMDQDDWYDFNHFRPEVGRRFLATILSEMEEEL